MTDHNVIILFLVGKKGVGKDEAFKRCKEYFTGKRFVKRFAFADKLKDITYDLLKAFYGNNLPILRKDLDDPILKEKPFYDYKFRNEPLVLRKVLQYIGTEIFRKYFHSDIWIHLVQKQIINHLDISHSNLDNEEYPNLMDKIKNITYELLIAFYGDKLSILHHDLDNKFPIYSWRDQENNILYQYDLVVDPMMNIKFRDESLIIQKVLEYIENLIIDLIKSIDNNSNELSQGKRIFILTDCRFENEITQLKSNLEKLHFHHLKFITLRILRKQENIIDFHASENSLDDFLTDFTINNYGTLEEFYNKLDEFYHQL